MKTNRTQNVLSDDDWLQKLIDGDETAMTRAFSTFYPRLLSVAKRYMQGLNLGMESGVDFASSAFRGLCQATNEGRVQFDDQSDLWGFLCCLTIRKVLTERRKQRTAARRYKRVFFNGLTYENSPSFVSLERERFSPRLTAELEDERRRLVDLFEDNGRLQDVVQWRLDGFTPPEIAEKLDVQPRTVSFYLTKIKERWLRIQNLTDIVELKFVGLPDATVSEETTIPVDWIVFFRRFLLSLWRKEPLSKWNDPTLTDILDVFLESGEIIPPKKTSLFLAREFSIFAIRNKFEQIAERWKRNLSGRWLSVLENEWNRFDKESARSSKPES